MREYMVLFDPLDHLEADFKPPPGVEGGLVGDADTGIMGVYDVPEEIAPAFEESLRQCSTVLSFNDISQDQEMDR